MSSLNMFESLDSADRIQHSPYRKWKILNLWKEGLSSLSDRLELLSRSLKRREKEEVLLKHSISFEFLPDKSFGRAVQPNSNYSNRGQTMDSPFAISGAEENA